LEAANMSAIERINPGKTNLPQAGLPWLLKQPQVTSELSKMSTLCLERRESSFDVFGHINIFNKERFISVSTLETGSGFSARSNKPLFLDGTLSGQFMRFKILNIHAHPYERGTISFFSQQDLWSFETVFESHKLFDCPDSARIDLSKFSLGLLQIIDKKPGHKNHVALLFLQARPNFDIEKFKKCKDVESSDMLAHYLKMGFRVSWYSFPYGELGNPLVFDRPTLHGRKSKNEIKIWYKSEDEGKIIKHAKDGLGDNNFIAEIMRESKKSDVREASLIKSGAVLDDHALLPALIERLKRGGLFETSDILEMLGIRGPVMAEITKSFKNAADQGEIKPDFHCSIKGERYMFWKPESDIFAPWKEVAGLLSEAEVKEQYYYFNFIDPRTQPELVKLTRVVVGPDGKEHKFFMPELFEHEDFTRVEEWLASAATP
jgi:hypothetical protein